MKYMLTEEEMEYWIFGGFFDKDLSGGGNPHQIIIKKSLGCACIKCKDFFEYAEPNRDDGTFKCWSCSH